MRPREPRRKVLIDARLRHEGGWSDARILDISSRGLCVHADRSPRQGSYVEICKGSHRIIARVVWTRDERFGVRSQDRVAVDSITTGIEPSVPAAAARANDNGGPARPPGMSERHEWSRRRARAIEFLGVAMLGVGAAILAYDAVKAALMQPLEIVSLHLGRN